MKNFRQTSNARRGPTQAKSAATRSLSDEEAKLLNDLLEIAGSVRARELRVDEARGIETTQGHTTTRRFGLPATGAVEGVTYRNVRVDVSIKGRPERKTSKE
jgi:hypothetical protein